MFTRLSLLTAFALVVPAAHLGALQSLATREKLSLRGAVTELATGVALENARVTLFTPNLSLFRETRTGSAGRYGIGAVPAGTYRLGVALPDYGYQEQAVTIGPGLTQLDLELGPETDTGSWAIIGNTLPETLDATDIGVLLPDGRIFYCHDTTDPILFNPTDGTKSFPPASGSPQGCMNSTLLSDGSVLIVGGQDGSNPGDFVNGIPWVKRFQAPDQWTDPPDLVHTPGRWYPGLARLADGSLLAMGGGQSPDATRTETCERMNLSNFTWSYTDSLATPLEFPPSALLYTGDVLQTWGGQPQLYDPVVESWSSTGNFVFPSRGWPGHSDHSLLVLTDGSALAVGVNPISQPGASMTERYDPASKTWSTGTSPSLVRFQAEVVYLPDGSVFIGGGDKGVQGGVEPDVLGIVRRCDLHDPDSGSWRRIPNMSWYREYHAVTLLLHDGRIATTGGTYIKFSFGPTSADIEAYSPPYLSRGVRPQLSGLSDPTPSRGTNVDVQVFPATRLTHAVLMGMQSTTHWLDAGIPRRLELPIVQSGSTATIQFPSDPDLLPLGWYLLFGMVDDIPSVALSVRVDA